LGASVGGFERGSRRGGLFILMDDDPSEDAFACAGSVEKASALLFAPMLDILEELRIACFDKEDAGEVVAFAFFLEGDEVEGGAFVVVIEVSEKGKARIL
jgi:hypothetical protein